MQILTDTYEDATNNEDMISPTNMAAQLIEWTDPTRVMCVVPMEPP
jgi:hypothetical protein